MSQFDNVTVIREANIYFDGRVTSRTVLFPDGTKKTLGIMLPGDYEFSTAQEEIMEILAGEMEVLLPGESNWQVFAGGHNLRFPLTPSSNLRSGKSPIIAALSWIRRYAFNSLRGAFMGTHPLFWRMVGQQSLMNKPLFFHTLSQQNAVIGIDSSVKFVAGFKYFTVR